MTLLPIAAMTLLCAVISFDHEFAHAAAPVAKVVMTTGSVSEREGAVYVAQERGFFRKYGVNSLSGGGWIFTMLTLDYWGLVPERDKIQFRSLGDQSVMVQGFMAGTVDAVLVGYARGKNLQTVDIGSDADLVLFDPKIRKQIRKEDLHQGTDHTIFEGWEVQGFPKMTLSRGNVLVENGVWVGSDSEGQWLARRIDPAIIRRSSGVTQLPWHHQDW